MIRAISHRQPCRQSALISGLLRVTDPLSREYGRTENLPYSAGTEGIPPYTELKGNKVVVISAVGSVSLIRSTSIYRLIDRYPGAARSQIQRQRAFVSLGRKQAWRGHRRKRHIGLRRTSSAIREPIRGCQRMDAAKPFLGIASRSHSALGDAPRVTRDPRHEEPGAQ